jgi:cell division protein FtsW
MPVVISSRKVSFRYDYWILSSAGTLLGLGLLLLASASMGIADRQYNAPFHYLLHQLAYVAVGFVLAVFVLRLPVSFWQKIRGHFLILSIFLLVLVLIPGIGREINGSFRWLGVGPITLQVSELAKIGIVIFTAGFIEKNYLSLEKGLAGFIKIVFLLGVAAILLLLEPDFGATVVLITAITGMLFFANARLSPFVVLFLAIIFLMSLLAISSPYRFARLTSFLNPWASPYGSGYQLTQSLIAFGRGGVWGVGLGNGIQKLFYLPEAHTDFLYAILGEELGIVGQFFVLALFGILVGRVFYLARLAKKISFDFMSYLAFGFGILLATQTIINIGVNTGLLPTKGLTLPLMSYGGSSMLFSFVLIAILLRISCEIQLTTNLAHRVGKNVKVKNKRKTR